MTSKGLVFVGGIGWSIREKIGLEDLGIGTYILTPMTLTIMLG
jgi:hypothetical protein